MVSPWGISFFAPTWNHWRKGMDLTSSLTALELFFAMREDWYFWLISGSFQVSLDPLMHYLFERRKKGSNLMPRKFIWISPRLKKKSEHFKANRWVSVWDLKHCGVLDDIKKCSQADFVHGIIEVTFKPFTLPGIECETSVRCRVRFSILPWLLRNSIDCFSLFTLH